ncbi:hypothetical protein ACX0G7_09755 [Flavitalea antarctica]
MKYLRSRNQSSDRLSLCRDDFAIIGRALVIRDLALAQEIINDELLHARSEWKIEKVPQFYSPGMDRRLFIGVILKSYHSEHYLNAKKFAPKRGLVTQMANVLGMPPSNVSVLAREVAIALRVYDDFRTQVESHLQNQNNSAA